MMDASGDEDQQLIGKKSYGADRSQHEEPPSVRYASSTSEYSTCQKIYLVCLVAATIMMMFLLIFVGIVVGSISTSVRQQICSNPPLLLISLDGFWNGYLERDYTPFIKSLAANGVRAEYMQSEFPTETFPNHFSIVTGLHPESHGIVNNGFYDSVLRANFTYREDTITNDPKWWLGVPIWVTAAKHGLRSGVYFWPGSEVQGLHPTYFFSYNKYRNVSFGDRVNTVLSWLDQPSGKRPQFFAMYFNQPDNAGHRYGPDSEEVNEWLSRVDQTVESLFAGLKERGVEECVNVIITSDHGMATYNRSKLAVINQYLPPGTIMTNGTVSSVYVLPEGDRQSVINTIYNSLKQDNDSLALTAYLTKDLPFRLHAGHFNKQRYGDIYLIGEEGSYVSRDTSRPSGKGVHGYNNNLVSMQAIFIAHGPAFKKGYVADGFANIQLYNLMCGLLGITPSPNNGTAGALNHILTPSLLTTLPPPQVFQGSPGVHDSCPYPTDQLTYNTRSFCRECVCSGNGKCADVSNNTIKDSNALLSLTANQIFEYQKRHLPWGVPIGGEGSASCLLTQQDFVSLYSNALRVPLWSAFKLTGEQASLPPSSSGGCLRRDPRLSPSHSSNCSDYTSTEGEGGGEFVPVRLTAALSTSSPPHQLTTNLLSNVVPQLENFNEGVWQPVEKLLRSWAVNFTTIHVILGSVFDTNRDGERDNDHQYNWWMRDKEGGVAVPTHFYAIAVKCDVVGVDPSLCGPEHLTALGLVLQHTSKDPSPLLKLLRFSLTPIRDIERLTGVNFFPDLTPQQQNTLELTLNNKLWTAL